VTCIAEEIQFSDPKDDNSTMEGKIHSRLINHKTMLRKTTCTFNFPESDREEEDDTLTHNRVVVLVGLEGEDVHRRQYRMKDKDKGKGEGVGEDIGVGEVEEEAGVLHRTKERGIT